MILRISIDMGNNAFDKNHGPEVSRILRELITEIENEASLTEYKKLLQDHNGNSVGKVVVDD